jgi:DNA-binding NarL/FixJ family response regulator
MRILLLDEQPLFRAALVALLRERLGVGEVEVECPASVAEARQALGRRPAQLVLADFASGDVCGHPGLEGVVEAAGHAAVVAALDARPVAEHARRARSAGARAYLPKTASPELLEAALALLLAGGSYFPELESAPRRAGARLSPRQTAVMELLDRGLRNHEIAQSLGISVATVKLHVHAILKATGARSRTELLVRNRQAAARAAPAGSGRDELIRVPAHLLERSRGFMVVLAGPRLEHQFANPTYLRLIGKRDIIGKPLLDVLPDIEPEYLDIIDGVRRTRQVFVGHCLRPTLRDGAAWRTLHINLVAQPLLADDASVAAVLLEGCDLGEPCREEG